MRTEPRQRLLAILFAATMLFAMIPVRPAAAAAEPGASITSTATAAAGSVPATATASASTAATVTPAPAAIPAPGATNSAIWADDPGTLEITSPADGVLRSATGKISFTYTTKFDLSALNAADMPDQLSLDLYCVNWPGSLGNSDGRVIFDMSSLKVAVAGVDVTAQGVWQVTTDPADPLIPQVTWSVTGSGAAAKIAAWSGKAITVTGTMPVKDPATLGARYQSEGAIVGFATLVKTGATPDDDVIYDESNSDQGLPNASFEVRIGVPDPDSIVYINSNASFAVNGNPGYVFLDPAKPSLTSLPVLTDPTGVHTFLGWSNEPGVNNKVDILTYDDLGNMDYGQWGPGMFVYAVWSGDDAQTATVTVDSNGAGFPAATFTYPAGTYWREVFDDYAGLPTGWQQSYTDSEGVHYLLGYSVSPTTVGEFDPDTFDGRYPGDAPDLTWDANLTLYAVWSKAFPVDATTITFDYNRGGGALDVVPNGLTPPYVVIPGQPLSASFSDLGNRDFPPSYLDETYLNYGWPQGPDFGDGFSNYTLYYNFQGWSTDPGPDNTVNVDLNTVVSWSGVNQTVYAVWDRVEVPNADVWANDPNELKVTAPSDATLRGVGGSFDLSYTTSYDISMVDPLILPDTLLIDLWTYQDPQIGIDTDTLQVFVDGVDVTSSVSFLVYSDVIGDVVPATGLQESVSLQVDDPALVAAWSGKTIQVVAQARLMSPDAVKLPCKAEGQFDVQVSLFKSSLSDDESGLGAAFFQNQYLLDEEQGIWTGTAAYYLDIPADEEPPVVPPAPIKGLPTSSGSLPQAGDSRASLLPAAIGLIGAAGVGLRLSWRRHRA